MRIAMVGTRGVPARYGGFETAIEEIGTRLAARGHQVRVYSRTSPEHPRVTSHLGMEVVTLPALHHRALETLSHTGFSTFHLLTHRTEVAFLFNAANAPWLPFFRASRIPVAVHVDGLEWKRGKWGPRAQRYYRWAEGSAVRRADALIADAAGISRYYQREFGVETRQIAYGAPIIETPRADRLTEMGLTRHGFHLVVARFEPENHVDVIVSGYAKSQSRLPLVVVGSAPYSDDYTARVHGAAAGDPRVRFLGGVWDQELLDQLYMNALTYVHGHSVGGTNPSLLRAIGAAAPTAAFDVEFNREVLGENGLYFRDPTDVAACLHASEGDTDGALQRGLALQVRARDYDWDVISDQYEQLAEDLASGAVPGPQRHARRPRIERVTPDRALEHDHDHEDAHA